MMHIARFYGSGVVYLLPSPDARLHWMEHGISDHEGAWDQRFPNHPPPLPREQTDTCEDIAFP